MRIQSQLGSFVCRISEILHRIGEIADRIGRFSKLVYKTPSCYFIGIRETKKCTFLNK